MKIKDTLHAYLAGIIDGEGHILAYKAWNSIYVIVGATNTCEDVLQLLQRAYGGVVHKRNRKQKPHHKIQFTWTLRRKDHVKEALSFMLPYLVIKQEKASNALRVLLSADPEVVKESLKFFGNKVYTTVTKKYEGDCLVCRKPFVAHKASQKTCNKSCARTYQWRQWRCSKSQKSA